MKKNKNLLIQILIVVSIVFAGLPSFMKQKQDSGTLAFGRVAWSTFVDADTHKYCGFWVESREILPTQFHNNITKESGKFQNNEVTEPGPSPFADELAKRPGVSTVNMYKHRIFVDYYDDVLDNAKIATEISEVKKFIECVLGKSVNMTHGIQNITRSNDCDSWKGSGFSCRIDTIYIPNTAKPDWERVLSIPGVESYDGYGDGGHEGEIRIHKSLIYSWDEIKPQLEPLLASAVKSPNRK